MPEYIPFHGCPQDPNIYPDSPNPKGRVIELYKPTTQCFIPGCDHTICLPPEASTTSTSPSDSSGNFSVITKNKEGRILLNQRYHPLRESASLFGTAAGFHTNLGVVAPPTSPIGGYIYTESGWNLYATPG